MMRDAQPAMVCCGDAALQRLCARRGPARHARCCWRRSSPRGRRAAPRAPFAKPVPLADSDPVTIIYTSGTSGESKGVVLNAGNVTYMLSCTTARLDLLMGQRAEPDRVFHYLPFCFAGSWILLLSCFCDQRAAAVHRSDAPGRRLARRGARLLPERAATARTHALGGGSANRQARRDIEQDLRQGESGFAGPANGAGGGSFAACGAEADFPGDPQKAGAESQGADLRFGAAGAGDAAFLSRCWEFPCCRSTASRRRRPFARWTIRGTSNRAPSGRPFPESR